MTTVGVGGRLATQRLFGLDFVADATIDEVAGAVLDEGGEPSSAFRCVVTPNVDHLVRYDRLPDDAAIARSAFLVLPDGMPIVWASRLLRRPLQRRLTGADLFGRMWPALARAGIGAVVIAPSPVVADQLQAEHPGARCVIPPIFDADDTATVRQIVDEVTAAADGGEARFVFIGLSVAKTHVLASACRARWEGTPGPHPVVLLVGAAPEFHLGLVSRAPDRVQRWGLEWLYRLVKEPRRLARRYLVDDTRFARLVWREARRPS
jgi:N-acetylglucosaminyldiphosphoundecaprenol N-acetyl-beta-D-mannosaminyltransferase